MTMMRKAKRGDAYREERARVDSDGKSCVTISAACGIMYRVAMVE